MKTPRALRPLPGGRRTLRSELEGLGGDALAVLHAPADHLPSEGVARELGEQGLLEDALWLRLSPLDRMPELAYHSIEPLLPPGAEPAPLERPVAFDEVGARLGRLIPNHAVLVLEDPASVARNSRVTDVLTAVRAARSDGAPTLLLSHTPLPRRSLTEADVVISAKDLASDGATIEMLDSADLALGLPALSRLMRVAGRRRALVEDVLDAAAFWGPELVADVVATSLRPKSLVDRLTRRLIVRCSPAELDALAEAAEVGYWRQDGAGEVVAVKPWFLPLEGGWHWLRPLWARALRRDLAGLASGRLHRVAPPPVHPVTVPDQTHPVQAGVADAAPVVAATSEPDHDTTGSSIRDIEALERPVLAARLLGNFELSIDGRPVPEWTGRRGLMVLKYLLIQPRFAAPRDVLLDRFWTDVDPKLARRRLHVALAAVRRDLRGHTPVNVVDLTDDVYRVNPEVEVETDVIEFNRRIEAGLAQEAAGEVEHALASYGGAVDTYVGDLYADLPYEEWTLLPREALRLAYVDVLDRVTQLLVAAGNLDECISNAKRILDVDPCREDAHRLLMHCYAEQGRAHMARQQYKLCTVTLETQLDTPPSEETVALYYSISRA